MTEPNPSATAAPTLPLARFRFSFVPKTQADGEKLASLRRAFLGSAWRGALGHALKSSVCVTKLAECDGCPLVDVCPYPYLFESRTPADAAKLTRYPFTPGPYVLEPRTASPSGLRLGVTLFGSAAVEHLPTFVQALSRAGTAGLTSRCAALDLASVEAEAPGVAAGHGGWQLVHEPQGSSSAVLGASLARYAAPRQAPAAVRVRLLAPLRIRQRGRHIGPQDMAPRTFAAHLVRRISLLTYFFSDVPLETDFAALLRHAESFALEADLHWRDGARRSSRQGATVPLGGLVGSFVLRGDLAPLWPVLWLGQWTHAGKACSMGLGRYVLEAVAGGQGAHWPTPSAL